MRNAVHRFGPWAIVALTVVFNLWVLRAEVSPVPNLNDGTVHRSMIGWAEERWRGGHLPLDGWYPELGLGSSRFHHYQSLPHVVTGLLAIPLGSHRAYSVTLYLGLALWPIAVFAGGRLFGLGRWRSAAAALLSPLVVSAPTLGYEWGSYAWRGYGTWTQLWGMWLLPLAWGLGYRAVVRGRSYAWAALVVALSIAVHLLTGYLALLSLGVLALLRPTRLLERIRRAALVGIGSVLVAAWVVVPLLVDRAFTVQDEFSRGKVFYDSFGAGRILSWLASGELFDRNRFPILTILFVVGLGLLAMRWRRDERARAILAVGLLSLLLFFGRSTLGPLLRLLPGSGDLFLRRYVFGVHLAGLYLMGVALAWLGRVVFVRLRSRLPEPRAVLAGLVVVAVALLGPAWYERQAWAAQGAEWMREQRVASATDGADLAALVRRAGRLGPGRIYAGSRSNWGSKYRIGQVPAYAQLLNLDAEAVGFTRPTWSLSSPAEYRFRDANPDHFDVFDVRYLIQPSDRPDPVQGELVTTRGRHELWRMPVEGTIEVVDTGQPIDADRTDLGEKIAPWLSSELPTADVHPAVAFAGIDAPEATVLGDELPAEPPGSVVEVFLDLAEGRAAATVDLDRPGAVVLKASFDNRWVVTVDNRRLEPQMFAPSLVGRVVSPGRHDVVFQYAPFPRYDLLLLIGAATFVGLLVTESRRSRRSPGRSAPRGSGPAEPPHPARLDPAPSHPARSGETQG
ncbi:MAG TPA: hypothetical protein VF129_14900 [Actinomycetota bacterium]